MKHNKDLDRFSSRFMQVAMLVVVPLTLVLGVQAISWAVPSSSSSTPLVSTSGSWFECGVFEDLRTGPVKCQIAEFPVDQYEYGFRYSGIPEISVAECNLANFGYRLITRYPHMILADNPIGGTMRQGGAIFYTETSATDDDNCPPNTWRHRYWQIVNGNVQVNIQGNGCFNLPLYCRQR